MSTPEAKAKYTERVKCELPNAWCRNHGLGQVPVRGKQKLVKVYEVLDKSLQPVAAPSARAVVHPLRHALALKAKAGS